MAKHTPQTVPYRRKREQRTNYKKRLRLLLAKKPRLVVRFTNTRIIAQVITFAAAGDKVHVAVDSQSLAKLGWVHSQKNIPAAYLMGRLIAKKALGQGIKGAIFDTGQRKPLQGGKVYAFLKGAIDAGLVVPADNKVFPTQDRVLGKPIADYSAKVQGQELAQALKNNIGDISKHVEQLVEKIQNGA